jgi:hypothetical protein
MPDLITQTEAAALKNISLQGLQKAMRQKRLTVYEQYGRRLLDRQEVENWTPNASRQKGRESQRSTTAL